LQIHVAPFILLGGFRAGQSTGLDAKSRALIGKDYCFTYG